MGTNYYLRYPKCKHCGQRPKDLHIGKSSAGWCFGLHVYPEDASLPQNSDDWEKLFDTYQIFDEYGEEISVCGMMETILDRSSPTPVSKNQ